MKREIRDDSSTQLLLFVSILSRYICNRRLDFSKKNILFFLGFLINDRKDFETIRLRAREMCIHISIFPIKCCHRRKYILEISRWRENLEFITSTRAFPKIILREKETKRLKEASITFQDNLKRFMRANALKYIYLILYPNVE